MKTLVAAVMCLLAILGCDRHEIVEEEPLLLSTPRASATYVWMLAQISGQLIVQNGCIAIHRPQGGTHTLVFPPDYSLGFINGQWQITNSFGHVIGSVGDHVELGGGEIPSLPPGISPGCNAPFWKVTPIDVRERVPPGNSPPPIPS